MLSLLSLIIASGTVLRADTEQWEPFTYPDPRTNATQCNTVEGSTLCDPDHLLPDTWRQTIYDNIQKHTEKLRLAELHYTEEAAERCRSNTSEDVQMFVILAKRIQTASNQSITSNDLTNFGHGLREAFGLDKQECQNYVLILGVELAKEIYVWTGSDLLLPKEQMDHALSQYKNMFNERNYQEGVNKIVDEVGELLLDPFKDSTTQAPEDTSSATEEPSTTTATEEDSNVAPTWVYILIIFAVVLAFGILLTISMFIFRRGKGNPIHPFPLNDGKVPPVIETVGTLSRGSTPLTRIPSGQQNSDDKDGQNDVHDHEDGSEKSFGSGISLPRTQSMTLNDRKDNLSFGATRFKKSNRVRNVSDSSALSGESVNSHVVSEVDEEPNEGQLKVHIQQMDLATDELPSRVKSDSELMTSSAYHHTHEHFSSF